jgi:hypothetical protein
MSHKSRFVFPLATLFVVLGISNSLPAQGYNRTQTTGSYIERSGVSIATEPRQVDTTMARGNALLVPLPFTFRCFNRNYSSCWISTSGRVSFDAYTADETSVPGNLTPPVSLPWYCSTIFAIGGDLITRDDDLRLALGAYVESDRVVLQWRTVTGFSTAHCEYLNFQVHLLSNGNIEMHYGPESSVLGYTANFPWVSGVVNQSGSAAVAGFGNTLIQQTTRPPAGTVVALALSTIATAGVTINQNPLPGRRWLTPPSSNAPVLSFKLVASGSGATVTLLEFDHPDFAADGNPVSLALVRDTAPIGQYNGEASIGTVVTTGGTSDVTGLSETIGTGQSFDYLLLASFSTLVRVSQDTCGCYAGTGIDGGGAVQVRTGFAPRGYARMAASLNSARPGAAAGATRQRMMSFSIVQDIDSPSFTVDQFAFQLTVSGMSAADFSQLQLWRDRGTIGEWDSADVLLGTVSSVTATNYFTGLSEATSLAGTPYLVTADISAAFTGAGNAYISWLNPAEGSPVYETLDDGDLLFVSGNASSIFMRDFAAQRLVRIPAAVSEANVHASCFEAWAVSGSGSISSLFFAEAASSNSQIANPRLYVDNGTVNGRYDASDTLVPATPALAAAGFTLNFGTPLAIGSTPQRFALIVDIAATSVSDMRFSLSPSGVASTFGTVLGLVSGTQLNWRAGGANGVDVSVQMLSASIAVSAGTPAAVARVTCAARGTGGSLPILFFPPLGTPGGRGNNSGVHLQCFIEGAGPLGVLDATDRECYTAFPVGGGIVSLQQGATSLCPAGVTRDFLIVAAVIASRDRADVRGSFSLNFAGLLGGTDVALLPAGTPQPFAPVSITYAAPAGGNNGSDDGGCSTAEHGNSFTLLAALGALVAALWLRGRLQSKRTA